MSEEQEMQFADPAWQPKVTREFEAIAPMPAPTGAPNSGANAATTPQAGEALYDDYAQGYRAQSASTAGPENPSQGQPFQEQEAPAQNQRPPRQGPSPFQGQQAPFGQQQSPTFQSLQDQLKRLPRWVWWVVGIVILSSIVQPAADQGGPIGALFGLVFIGLLAFIGWLLWTRRVRVSLSGETQETETHTFTVSAQPTLILKNKAGSINLRAGQEGQVSITTTRRGYLFSQRFNRETQIWYSQDSTNNTVNARTESWRPFGKNTITFEVTVPPQANLQLSTNFGIISVENIRGQMTLKSDAGTIQASGVTLQGKSHLKSDAGTITFSGSLDPAGTYEMRTNLGTVHVTLPTDASFNLDAKTDIGVVTADLPLAQPQRNKLSGLVGSGPHPRLKLKTDIGTINVERL